MAKIIQFPARKLPVIDPGAACVRCEQPIHSLYARTADGPVHVGSCPSAATASVFADARSNVGVWWPPGWTGHGGRRA